MMVETLIYIANAFVWGALGALAVMAFLGARGKWRARRAERTRSYCTLRELRAEEARFDRHRRLYGWPTPEMENPLVVWGITTKPDTDARQQLHDQSEEEQLRRLYNAVSESLKRDADMGNG